MDLVKDGVGKYCNSIRFCLALFFCFFFSFLGLTSSITHWWIAQKPQTEIQYPLSAEIQLGSAYHRLFIWLLLWRFLLQTCSERNWVWRARRLWLQQLGDRRRGPSTSSRGRGKGADRTGLSDPAAEALDTVRHHGKNPVVCVRWARSSGSQEWDHLRPHRCHQ